MAADVLVRPLSSAIDTNSASARKSPDWLSKSVVYEIFPRNFSRRGFQCHHGRLDELKKLGVDILWLMPIHPIGEKMKKGSIGSPCAVQDYRRSIPDYGASEDFKRLVAGAHQRGMKVIIDIISGHTAWDSVLLTQHPEFYKKDASGKIIPPIPDWTDVAALNYENPELRRYMTEMLKFGCGTLAWTDSGAMCRSPCRRRFGKPPGWNWSRSTRPDLAGRRQRGAEVVEGIQHGQLGRIAWRLTG